MDYIAVNFKIAPFSEDIADALMAGLGDLGYDGFEYTETGFTAYVPARDYREGAWQELPSFRLLSGNYAITAACETIADRDWNKEWESRFTPIVVNDKILVRAGFHDTIPGIPYEIIIEPKRSFGTGHHATTALMLGTLLDFTAELKGKQVLDMGCGTGILSIMAAKAGAAHVTGIDIDEWAFANATENIRSNRINSAEIKIGDAGLLTGEEKFDFILANINRNILLADMHRYTPCLAAHGFLILSGFYMQDLPMIRKEAERSGLSYRQHKTEENWVAVTFYKK